MILNNLLNIQVMIYSNTLIFLAESLKQAIIFLEQWENGIASPLILSAKSLDILKWLPTRSLVGGDPPSVLLFIVNLYLLFFRIFNISYCIFLKILHHFLLPDLILAWLLYIASAD